MTVRRNVRRGLTLVEIIVAIAIIGIVAVGFMAVMTNSLHLMGVDRKMTQDAFLVQQEMELKIDAERRSPSSAYVTIDNVFGDSRLDLKVLPLSYSNGGDRYDTIIAEISPPALQVPRVLTVTAEFSEGGLKSQASYAKSSVQSEGSNTMDPSTDHLFLVNNYQWYVSRPGFNIPYPLDSVHELEVGTKYPAFPSDYMPIPGATGSLFHNVSAYRGRHLVFGVTPAAKSGKLGEQMTSKPIFVYGLPILDQLLVHLDGSTVVPTDTEQVGTGNTVKKWMDISGNGYHAIAASSSQRPVLVDQGVTGNFIGRSVVFTGDILKISRSKPTETLQVFAVARGSEGATLLTYDGEEIKLTGEAAWGETNDWRLIHNTVQGNYSDIRIGDTVDIAELIIYRGEFYSASGEPTPAEKVAQIKAYLQEKYMALDAIGEVVKIYDATDRAYKGTTYTPPVAALADMVYGPDRYIPVKWDVPFYVIPDTANVNADLILHGAAYNDPNMKVKLTVDILQPVTDASLDQTSVRFYEGTHFPLHVTVQPADADVASIKWMSTNPAVATVDGSSGLVSCVSQGTTEIVATVMGGNTIEARCTVEVLSNPMLSPGVVLHLDPERGLEVYSGNVYEWRDQSGNSNHFTGGPQPTFVSSGINGLPSVSFNSSRQERLWREASDLSGINMQGNPNDFTVIVVGEAENSNASLFAQCYDRGARYTRFSMGYYNRKPTIILRNGSILKLSSSTSGVHVHTTRWNRSVKELLFKVDDVQRTVRNPRFSSYRSSHFYIGYEAEYNHILEGTVGEVLVFNRALSNDELAYVEAYLYDKWKRPIRYAWEFRGGSGDNILKTGGISGAVMLETPYPGIYRANYATGESYIQFKPSSTESLNAAKTIKLRLKNGSDAYQGALYYTTTSGGGFDEVKKATFAIAPNSAFIEYEIDMTGKPAWSGRLTGMKLVLDGDSGDFDLDYIRIIE